MNLRAGVVGLGTMGRHHVRVLSECPASNSWGRLTRAVARGCGSVIADVRGWKAAPPRHRYVRGGDAYFDAHRDRAQLAAAGVHALIEKPLASDPESGRMLPSSRHSLVGCVGHIERYNPALRALRPRMPQGELGPCSRWPPAAKARSRNGSVMLAW